MAKKSTSRQSALEIIENLRAFGISDTQIVDALFGNIMSGGQATSFAFDLSDEFDINLEDEEDFEDEEDDDIDEYYDNEYGGYSSFGY